VSTLRAREILAAGGHLRLVVETTVTWAALNVLPSAVTLIVVTASL
jgi:hypothetical protein